MPQRSGRRPGATRRQAVVLAAIAALVLSLLPPAAASAGTIPTDPRFGLEPGTDADAQGSAYTEANADAETVASGMELLANRPKPRWTDADDNDLAAGAFSYSNIGSDLAFKGDVAYSGNYRGFGIYDVSDPADPVLETIVNCVGGQGDLSVYGDLLFMSVESGSARTACSTDSALPVFRGVRIFDISDPLVPALVSEVQTCRGSHTHTVVEDLDDPSTVYVYVSGTSSVRSESQLAGCTNTVTSSSDPSLFLDENGDPVPTSRFQVEVIAVPIATPADAAIVNEARLMADPDTGNPHGLWPGGSVGPDGPGGERAVIGPRNTSGTVQDYQSTAATDACHDITAYPEIGLAAGACEGNGILIDISDPANPIRIDEVSDPNFAYWHSATFSNDGSTVVFTDEWGGGTGARCRVTDPEQWGADAIFDLTDTVDGPAMTFASYYSIPNVQASNETCVAHNGNLVPIPRRDVMVQAWYEGGVSVFDFTDTANPFEIAFFDRGPYHPTTFHQGGYWSVYWHNGQIYGNEIFLGFSRDGFHCEQLASERAHATPAESCFGVTIVSKLVLASRLAH